MSGAPPRALAARAVFAVREHGRNLDVALESLLAKAHLSPADAGLAKALAFGSCRWLLQLEWLATRLLQKPLKQKDADIQALLLVGLYQLAHMEMPGHAAINETVAASGSFKKPWARGLLNACLRRYQRERDALTDALATDTVASTAHPAWLLTRLQQAWPDQWQRIVQANNAPRPPFHLRVNVRRKTRDQALDVLREAGLQAGELPFTGSGIVVHTPCPVNQLPGFEKGWLSVQDGAAQLASELLEAGPNQRVLDACAAPGGKAAHLLEQHPDISLTAVEVDEARRRRIDDTLARLGLNADVITADAARPDHWWDGLAFDRILLDAPCSATGVIRRHPDIRLHRKPEDIDNLVILQARLLDALWPCLGEGGKLLYVTCSVLPEENDQQVAAFLARHPDAAVEPLAAGLVLPGCTQHHGQQVLPGDSDLDGFYYARLLKLPAPDSAAG